jgi:hypothetical protein
MRELLAGAALLAVTGWLYHGALWLWWLEDDFFHLLHVHAWGPADYALDPALWPFRNVTPLLLASYDLDLTLFGPRPFPFYLHQLLALGLAAVALYALLRCWLPLGWALVGSVLSLAGLPTLSLAPLLMVRHYVEGLLLSCLAVHCWVASLRARGERRARLLAALSALCWLAAAFAKEIFLPLLAVLPFVPEGSPRTRLRRLLPHGVAAGVYIAYRWYLLRGPGGGYGWAVEGSEWWRLVAALPLGVGRQLAGPGSLAAWLALALLGAGAAVLLARGGRGALLAALAAPATLLPVLPVSTELEPRYALAAWVALVVAFVFGVRPLPGGAAAALVAALALLLANRQAWAAELDGRRRMSSEHLALLEMGPGEMLRKPTAPSSALEQAALFARQVLDRDAAGGWFADDLYLCSGEREVGRLWQYDERAHRLVDATAELPALRRLHCDRLRRRAPLAVSLDRRDGVLRWTLGPYQEGSWHFVFDEGVAAFPVPRSGAYRVGEDSLGPLRVRYDAPDGWTTYSAVLAVPAAGPSEWRRPPGRRRLR